MYIHKLIGIFKKLKKIFKNYNQANSILKIQLKLIILNL